MILTCPPLGTELLSLLGCAPHNMCVHLLGGGPYYQGGLVLHTCIICNQCLSQVQLKGLTTVLVLSVASAVIGGSTQFGYNSGVINSPKNVSPETIPSFIAGTGMGLEFMALE